MMDNSSGRMLALFVMAALFLSGCQMSTTNKEQQSADEQIENQNTGCDSEALACMPGETDSEPEAKDEASFNEMSFNDAISFFEDKKTGLLYFGFADCPWCQEIVPILDQALKENGKSVHSIQTRDSELNRLYSDEQKAEIEKYISDYMSEDDQGVLTLYVPLVLYVENGEVVDGHQGTVDEHDAHERKMTDQEKQEVTEIIDRIVKKAR
ncbi:TlpA family protein disulfide reductase [Ileibacterium valens]|uniref:Thioredoxin domain-containing protein n=1 Tax=Ileibacterium valens TaxID=1862668 RepID=A0A1U7NFL6_9FIRM|nr:thioredoxin family protein [Ileibacterium valens]OLU38945.1 hypothetical protein BO224_08185 [Erysipelotrichaceae bacterium NYU-BL-E8]OLU39214.1 hypothetical protein BO222_06985 [Ileibacterium valens]OLU42191.1 hypothetical protein BM735_02870 [Erysipelotrichaceae bacterium NYU-BL-F16]